MDGGTDLTGIAETGAALLGLLFLALAAAAIGERLRDGFEALFERRLRETFDGEPAGRAGPPEDVQ